VVEPMIKAGALAAGIGGLLREVLAIRRTVRKAGKDHGDKMSQSEQGEETFNFIAGLILGVILSAPVAAWLSPRSGPEVRQSIVQRGRIVRRRVGQTIRKPLELAQDQITQLRGDSVQRRWTRVKLSLPAATLKYFKVIPRK